MPIYITEFDQGGIDTLGRRMQAAKMPAVDSQRYTVSGASQNTAVFSQRTTLVRVHTDQAVAIVFGPSPTAAATDMRLGPGQTEYFSVQPNSALRIAFIQVT